MTRSTSDGFDDEEKQRRSRLMYDFLAQVGERYRDARLHKFRIYDDRQRPVVDAVQRYIDDLGNFPNGNVVLFGPPGTGKDHLAVAIVGHAIWNHGLSGASVSGVSLFGQLRDSIRTEESERRIIERLIIPHFLIISDAVTPFGTLTEYQAQMLYLLVDERYRRCRPIVATLNVANGDEAASRLGSQVVSRLKHDALTLHCNWPDYREGHSELHDQSAPS